MVNYKFFLKMKTIEKYYNLISPKYNEAALNFKWRIPNKIKNLLDDYNLVISDLVILDIGIGTGQTIDFFKDKNCKIFGIDISSKMLALIKQKYPQVKTIKWNADKGIFKLFKKDFFNMIISGGMFEFIENIEKIINESYQILKKDGYFVFTYEILI